MHTLRDVLVETIVIYGRWILPALVASVWSLILWHVSAFVTGWRWHASVHEHMDEIARDQVAMRDKTIVELKAQAKKDKAELEDLRAKVLAMDLVMQPKAKLKVVSKGRA